MTPEVRRAAVLQALSEVLARFPNPVVYLPRWLLEGTGIESGDQAHGTTIVIYGDQWNEDTSTRQAQLYMHETGAFAQGNEGTDEYWPPDYVPPRPRETRKERDQRKMREHLARERRTQRARR